MACNVQQTAGTAELRWSRDAGVTWITAAQEQQKSRRSRENQTVQEKKRIKQGV
jgi:hypothetical protein